MFLSSFKFSSFWFLNKNNTNMRGEKKGEARNGFSRRLISSMNLLLKIAACYPFLTKSLYKREAHV